MEVIVELLSTFVRVLIVEFLFGTLFYWLGWGFCKVVTLGKYPNSLPPSNRKTRETWVFVLGFIVSLVIFLAFIYWG